MAPAMRRRYGQCTGQVLKEYVLVKERNFYDAWAQLYMRAGATSSSNKRVLKPVTYRRAVDHAYNETLVAIWNALQSRPFHFKEKGNVVQSK